MPLIRLAYFSTAQLSSDAKEERRQIADILLRSRRNNEERAVTGALLATKHNFAQALEGERADVEHIYRKICADKRHRDIVLVLTEPIDARQFAKWSMAYIGPSQSATEALDRVTTSIDPSVLGSSARTLIGFMSGVLAKADAPAN